MPVESILFLSLAIGALILFAAALAYGDWATRQAMREITDSQPTSAKVRKTSAALAALKAPAQKAAA
jgi:hypothetical protein